MASDMWVLFVIIMFSLYVVSNDKNQDRKPIELDSPWHYLLVSPGTNLIIQEWTANTNTTGMMIEAIPGVILRLRPANERRRYFVTTSLIGWAQTYNPPWIPISNLSITQWPAYLSRLHEKKWTVPAGSYLLDLKGGHITLLCKMHEINNGYYFGPCCVHLYAYVMILGHQAIASMIPIWHKLWRLVTID